MERVNARLAAAVVLGAAVATVINATPASAHPGHASSDAFTGLVHPLIGVDHLLAMVVVGILGVTLRRNWQLPAVFVGAMVVGGALAMAGMPLAMGEAAIALSIVALGGALVAAHTIGARAAMCLVGVAGFVHGHAHGTEAPTASLVAIYIAGVIATTIVLHAAGALIGMRMLHRPRTRTVLGALVTGAGLGLLAGIV